MVPGYEDLLLRVKKPPSNRDPENPSEQVPKNIAKCIKRLEQWFIACRSYSPGDLQPQDDWLDRLRLALQRAKIDSQGISKQIAEDSYQLRHAEYTRERLGLLVETVHNANRNAVEPSQRARAVTTPMPREKETITGNFGEVLTIELDGETATLKRGTHSHHLKGEEMVRLAKILVKNSGGLVSYDKLESDNGGNLNARDRVRNSIHKKIGRLKDQGFDELGLIIQTHRNLGYSLELMNLNEDPPPAES